MRTLAVLALAALVCAAPYDGLKYVHMEMSRNVSKLIEDDEMWGHVNGVAELVVSEEKLGLLRKAGAKVTVVAEDVQAVIDAEMQRVRDAATRYTPKVHRVAEDPFFEEYRPWDQYETFLTNLAGNYSNLVTRSELGLTYEGRSIPVFTISSPAGAPNKPAVYIQAVVHAREWLANAATAYILNALVTGYGTDADITHVLDSVDFHITPTVNIDGYTYSWTNGNRMWRKNRRANVGGTYGVDLNRNWGPESTWCTSGSSTNPSSDTYCGTAAFSEPETRASDAFIMARPAIVAAVDMHTSGPLILWPWQHTYTPLDEPHYSMFVDLGGRMQTAIANTHGQQYRSIQGSDLYPHSGGLIDYAWETRGIKSFTFEGRGPGFNPPASNIIPAGQEQLQAMLVLARDTLGQR